ncbi:STAG-domain-containing protein [Mollisia scopiformis]|uniref:STAG-domain-containing protein n=1 Tax=Mollisia scopiformis TaxID=149040 RepID=A0A132BD99_MOLSC|nr:STAG-domain-containing protein [Mollisia scopiformis]KUJ09959.1 STAG-domain-containing protein [Mollisia scopiformis]
MTTPRTPLMDISNNDVASTPGATASRRKSGRAVKVPEKFVPDVPSSQPGPASAKRKRGEDDAENDASDIEDDEDEEIEDEEEESAAEEEIKETKKKSKKPARKPAAKKPRVNGTTSHEVAPPVRLPARPKKTKQVAIADKDTGGLYADVYTSGLSSDDVAGQWHSRLAEDSPTAMVELVNFLLLSAGCTLEVTRDDIDDVDNVDAKVGDLQEEYQAQNITDYPLIKARSSHHFRECLINFFDSLLDAIHESKIMYTETALMENIHSWLIVMSSSPSRPFRHTATIAALAMTSAMCRVANEQIEVAAKVQRQLESEKKNKRPNKARVSEFQSKVNENEHQKAVLEHRIMDFFEGVYVHRYRDVDSKIRLECCESLGDWILTLESVFFEGQYLRYMGWMLSDTHGPMRQEVIKQLQAIMKDLNAGGMRHFIERFRPRLVEIATRDSESTVRASAVELMDSIRKAGMLEPDDIDVIGKLIFDSDPRVRKAVVPFFAESINDLYDSKVEDLGGNEFLEEHLAVEDEEDYDTPRREWIQLKCLSENLLSYDIQDQDEMPSQIDSADFLNVSGSESRFTLAAQALYEKVPVLKNWELLAGYLLFDHTSEAASTDAEAELRASFKPDEKEELILLEALNAVVKLGLSDAEEADKEKARKKHARRDNHDAREAAARRLAGLIPPLLKKYGADPKTATVVLRLEHVLNLNVFQELRQDSTVYAKLLDEISAQFNSHADKGVLNEAGAALLHARGYEELEEVADSKVQSLWEDTTSVLRKINKAGEISARGTLSIKILTELSHNLARLEQLASISSCVEALEAEGAKESTLPIVILLDIIARGVFEDSTDEARENLEDEIVLSAIRSGMFYFMWKVRSITEAVESGEEITDLDIDHLKEWQDLFTTNLIASFSSRSTLDTVRLVGAGTFLDLHVLFATLRPTKQPKGKKSQSEQASEENPYLQSLVKEVGPEVQTELASIFDGLEKQFAKKSKKKLADPSDDEAPEDLESESEEEEDDEVTDSERQAETLRAEQQLCELSGKLVLAILAQVIDASGDLKGKLRSRLQRNRQRLGPNFKEVVAYLDEPKSKAKKGSRSKSQSADPKKKAVPAKSAERVEEEEEEDDPFADVEPEEGTVEDLRRREILDEELEGGGEENGEEEGGGADDDDDDVMGD